MNPLRAALLTGLSYTTVLMVWCLSLLWTTPGAGLAASLLRQSAEATLLIQAIALALFTPIFFARLCWREALPGLLLLTAAPWPLLALSWQAEAAGLPGLALSQVAMLTLGLLLWGLTGLLLRLPQQLTPMLLPALGLSVAALLFSQHREWLILAGF